MYLELPSGSSRPTLKPRMSVMRRKSCANTHDDSDRPPHLSAGLVAFVFNRFATKPPLFHATAEDVGSHPRIERVELGTILSHRFACGSMLPSAFFIVRTENVSFLKSTDSSNATSFSIPFFNLHGASKACIFSPEPAVISGKMGISQLLALRIPATRFVL